MVSVNQKSKECGSEMKTESDLQRLLCKKSVKLAIAFLAPVLMLILVYNGLGLYPYENLTVLTSDLNNQYVSYFAYLVDSIKNGDNIFYTFSKAIGGDMYGLTGYYLLSPINIILMFGGKEGLPFTIMLVTLVKVGLSGLFMYIYFSEKRGYIYKNMMFAIAYALNGYLVAFIFNLMWLDAVYLLPLVILFVENIYKRKSSVPYILTLALTIISCYYTGYMVCVFTGLYGIYYLIIKREAFSKKFKQFIRFGLSSLLAVGISMVVLLPSLSALSGSKEVGDSFVINGETNFKAVDFLVCIFTGQSSGVAGYEKLPNLYFGIVMFVFLIGYFFNKNIKVREKIATFGVFVILFASMYFVSADMIWHGFAKPNMFYFRYSFVFSFMAIIVAEKCYHRIYGLNEKWRQAGVFAIAIVLLLLNGICVGEISNVKYMVLDVVVVAITVWVIMYYYKVDRDLIPALNILLILSTLASAVINTRVELSNMYFADRSISGYVEELEPVVEFVESKMDGEYRIEKNFYYSINDPMLLSYNGLSHFSSTEKAYVKNFMSMMGYRAYYEYWTHYGNGSTYAADSLLGVKYILTREPVHNRYTIMAQTEKINVYQNEYALPLVFVANDTAITTDILAEEMNTFEYQNALYSSLVGREVNIFSKFEYKDKQIVEELGEIHYLIEARNDENIYMYFQDASSTAAEIFINGVTQGNYFDSYGNGLIIIGKYQVGNVIDVCVKYTDEISNLPDPIVYTENVQVLSECIDELRVDGVVVNKESSSHLKCDITVPKDKIILTSIPYDENWKVYVDGEEVDTSEAFEMMLAIEVSEGTHTVEFKYLPKYFVESAGISILSVIILAFVVLYNARNKKKGA